MAASRWLLCLEAVVSVRVRCARSAVSTPPHLAQLARFSLPSTSPLGPCQGFAEIVHAESFCATLKVESTTGVWPTVHAAKLAVADWIERV
jgi:hypothetical protein